MSIQLIEVKRGFTVFTSLPLKVRLISLLSASSFGCEVPVDICSLSMQEWRFEFDTGCSND